MSEKNIDESSSAPPLVERQSATSESVSPLVKALTSYMSGRSEAEKNLPSEFISLFNHEPKTVTQELLDFEYGLKKE